MLVFYISGEEHHAIAEGLYFPEVCRAEVLRRVYWVRTHGGVPPRFPIGQTTTWDAPVDPLQDTYVFRRVCVWLCVVDGLLLKVNRRRVILVF